MTPTMATHRIAVAFAAQALHDAQHSLEAAFNTQNPDRIADAAREAENASYAYDRAVHQSRVLAERISDERWEDQYGAASAKSSGEPLTASVTVFGGRG